MIILGFASTNFACEKKNYLFASFSLQFRMTYSILGLMIPDNIARPVKKGLPSELEKETKDALEAIYRKYVTMKKRHLNHYRIKGIMYSVLKEIGR